LRRQKRTLQNPIPAGVHCSKVPVAFILLFLGSAELFHFGKVSDLGFFFFLIEKTTLSRWPFLKKTFDLSAES
jgi:hypothetical protein